ncbi:MAG: GSCFA domain-containing protein [Saprospiraceae bacterium]|nr:GSCFA domain-containing protein [Saprospiraceae bacterium]
MSLTSPPPFTTSLPLEQAPFRLSYTSRIVLMGSCFSTAIAERLMKDQFQIWTSPFGIVYDVSAMADQLELLLSDRLMTRNDLIHDGELYHSLLHHGQFSGNDPGQVVDCMNQELELARAFLRSAEWLLLTWATSRSFTHIESGRRTANNHQLPGAAFSYTYTQLEDLKPRYQKLIHDLTNQYPKLQIGITISPVRYLQDGFLANSRSKSTLHLLAADLETSGTWIFPSFEILQDELRDYRYYDPDLIHPSPMAIDLIYQRFLESSLADQDRTLFSRIQKVRQSLEHRLRFPEAPSGVKFLKKREEAVQQLRRDYPQFPWLFSEGN